MRAAHGIRMRMVAGAVLLGTMLMPLAAVGMSATRAVASRITNGVESTACGTAPSTDGAINCAATQVAPADLGSDVFSGATMPQ